MGRSRIVSASRSFSGSQVKGMDKHHVEGAGLAFCGGHKRHKPGAAGGRPPGHSQFGIYVVGKKEYVVACGVLLDPFKLCVRGKLRLIVRGDPDICCCGSHYVVSFPGNLHIFCSFLFPVRNLGALTFPCIPS